MAWVIDEVSEKIESALGMDHLTSIEVSCITCSSTAANELFDLLCGFDITE